MKGVAPSRDAVFLEMAEFDDLAAGDYEFMISYNDPDIGGNTASEEVTVVEGVTSRIDLFTMRRNNSCSHFEHHAEKLENEDVIEHSFLFTPEQVEKIATDDKHAETVAREIMNAIKDVHGTFYFSDIGVEIGEFLSEQDIKDQLQSSAPYLEDPIGSGNYQYGTYKRKISSSQTLKLAISSLELGTLVWRKSTSPDIDKFLSISSSIKGTFDFTQDRVDEWTYDEELKFDLAQLASISMPIIDFATNYQSSTEASLILNVGNDMIDYLTRDEVVVIVNGNILNKADNYNDSINPLDDSEPEYYVNFHNDEYTQIIVSNPNAYQDNILISSEDYIANIDTTFDDEISDTPSFEIIVVFLSLFILIIWGKKQNKTQ
jgi:hypothetical protein